MSRLTRGRMLALPVRGYHPLWPCFPDRFRLSCIRHWPGPLSLATTSGVSVDVLSSGYLDVSVPRVCFLHLCIQCKIPLRVGCPIRKSTDQSLFAAPRGLSQRTTSFIASQRQGIHRMPLRHLITLIVDARPALRRRMGGMTLEKRPVFFESCPTAGGYLRGVHWMPVSA